MTNIFTECNLFFRRVSEKKLKLSLLPTGFSYFKKINALTPTSLPPADVMRLTSATCNGNGMAMAMAMAHW